MNEDRHTPIVNLETTTSRIASQLPNARFEFFIIVATLLLAAVRIFVFCAAFPLFNNVDEFEHFDLVLKYSSGHVPRELERFSTASSEYNSLLGSPEYFLDPKLIKSSATLRPAWFRRPDSDPVVHKSVLEIGLNQESMSPPVYYGIAAGWNAIGRGLRVPYAYIPYWIRFLDIPLFCSLILITYALVRLVYPSRMFLRLSLPVILAFFPQDMFYSINSDVLSPVFITGAIYCLLNSELEKRDNLKWPTVAGLLLGLSCLVKLSNIPITIALIVWFAITKHFKGKYYKSRMQLVSLIVVSFLPLLLWCGRNYIVGGELVGAGSKAELLGWSVKPIGKMINHPIFTLHGVKSFLWELSCTFWRGEFYWHGRRLSLAWADDFYALTSVALPMVGLFACLFRWKSFCNRELSVAFLSAITLMSSIGFLAGLSVIFNFGKSPYPSQNHPYFTSGRLISGALVPFLVLYLNGLILLLTPIRSLAIRLLCPLGIILVTIISELILSAEVFRSEFNWFHMP